MTNKKKTTNNPEITLNSEKAENIKRSENFVSLYVNNVQFGYTRFDFQIMLGKVEISRDENFRHIQEAAVVTMTPEYAKAFLTDFTKVLNEYEKSHGEIHIRPDITK